MFVEKQRVNLVAGNFVMAMVYEVCCMSHEAKPITHLLASVTEHFFKWTPLLLSFRLFVFLSCSRGAIRWPLCMLHILDDQIMCFGYIPFFFRPVAYNARCLLPLCCCLCPNEHNKFVTMHVSHMCQSIMMAILISLIETSWFMIFTRMPERIHSASAPLTTMR